MLIFNRNPMSNKIISYITLHTLSSPLLGLGSVQVQVTQSQSTNTKLSGRAARHPSVEIERKNTVLGFPIEDEFLLLVNHCTFAADIEYCRLKGYTISTSSFGITSYTLKSQIIRESRLIFATPPKVLSEINAHIVRFSISLVNCASQIKFADPKIIISP